MSGRLTDLLDPRDTVARLGGDEFGVLVRSAATPAEGMQVANAIRRALAEPFVAEGVSLELGGSIGVAFHPNDGDDVETLMQRADVAMYQAKEGAVGVVRYSSQEDDSSLARLALAADLRRALENSEFVPYFQPKVDLRTGVVVGAEALLRWRHPTEKNISPDVFIPLAEQTGLIVPVTLQVISAAVRECALWRARGRDISVAVNLSARVLVDPTLPDHVEELCRCWDLPTRALVLEVTESMIVDDPARALPVVQRLAALGVRLSIDDFGTGYSSLEYLKVLPVAEMKIDRSFVAGMADDVRDAAIVRHSIELGRSLGLRVVAEGVESCEAHERLAAMGCDHGQGFLYSRACRPRSSRSASSAPRRSRCRRPSPASRRSPRGASPKEKPLEGGTAPRRPSPLRVLPCVARKATSKLSPAPCRDGNTVPGPGREGQGSIRHTD